MQKLTIDEFKPSVGKPTVRPAYEIKASDEVDYRESEGKALVRGLWFSCDVVPSAGDFICWLGEHDVYHIPKGVFHERNEAVT